MRRYRWSTQVVFDTKTRGQYNSARTSDMDEGFLRDSIGSVDVEQKLGAVWDDPNLRHPFRLRVLLLRWSDESHSQSVVELQPYTYPLAPSAASGVQPN